MLANPTPYSLSPTLYSSLTVRPGMCDVYRSLSPLQRSLVTAHCILQFPSCHACLSFDSICRIRLMAPWSKINAFQAFQTWPLRHLITESRECYRQIFTRLSSCMRSWIWDCYFQKRSIRVRIRVRTALAARFPTMLDRHSTFQQRQNSRTEMQSMCMMAPPNINMQHTKTDHSFLVERLIFSFEISQPFK